LTDPVTKRSTINDVAKKAGVSKATVSHVLNNTRFVEESTKNRVLLAIQEIGYRPSNVARSLTTNQTNTIGVVISDASNYFFGEILRGLEDILRPNGYGLVVCNTDETLQREAEYLDYLLRQRVDGIVAAATSQPWDVLLRMDTQHTPVVYMDRTFEGQEGPFVGVNNTLATRRAVQHLIDAGHCNIGIMAGLQRLSTMRERLAGYRQALQEAGIPERNAWVVESALDIDAAREAALSILSSISRPTALFINNNLLVLGTLLAMRELGLRCPQDISLIGFDDHPWAQVANPPLTVVRQPLRKLGQTAAQVLLTQIRGEAVCEPQYILDCELIVRESCCQSNSPTS
jgi:LacI family transcriptional regulator